MVSARHSVSMEHRPLGRILTSWVLVAGCLCEVEIVTREEVRVGDGGQNSGFSYGLTQEFIRMPSIAGIRKPS